MNEVQEEEFLLLRNLKDAGCDAEAVERHLRLRQAGKAREQLRLLSKQRSLLLEKIHEEQRKIDSLDYLLHAVKTKANTCKEKK